MRIRDGSWLISRACVLLAGAAFAIQSPTSVCAEATKGDIKIGDQLVVDGYLAKDGSHTIDARRVLLPDGRSVYGGTPGDGGPGDGDPRNG